MSLPASAETLESDASLPPASRLAMRFYRDRRLIVLSVLLALASGVSSMLLLPRMEDPLLTSRAANIITILPGANAEKVEALVTEKIEDSILDVPEIKRVRSQSRAGASMITIELLDDVYEPDAIWSELRGKVEESIADLPAEASRPVFDELEIAAYAWIGAVVWEQETPESAAVLRRLARDLKDRLFALEGTKLVDLFGDPLEEVVIEIDPDKAAAAGLTPAAIAAQLATRDVKSAAGTLRGDASDLVVQMGNEFESLQDIRAAIIRGNRPGQTLSLLDVATIRRTTPSPPASRVIVDGRPGVVVSVLLRPEYRIDRWAEQAHEIINGFSDELPPGISLDVIMEQETYVSERMDALSRNLLLGVTAVAIVTFVFMGWRSALLVTATLPMASLMVMAGMRFLEIPIHQMSVTGLIIALGLMIDNAIIATDEIQLSLRRGLKPIVAVGDMVRRLFAPLLASTVTTALAFAPIALMEGPAGEFVGAIAITVMLAIFSSFLLAMTVLPASAALLQGRVYANADQQPLDSEAKPSFWVTLATHGIRVPIVTQVYRRFLAGMLKYPWVGVGLGALLPVAGFISATQLDEQFFPPADRDQFHVELELAPHASLAETERLARQLESELRKEPRVKHVSWFMGESAPSFYYNIIARRANAPSYAQAIVTLESNQDSRSLIRRLQERLDDEFPSVRTLVRQLEQGPPFDAPVEIRLVGSDLPALNELGNEVRAMITALPDVLHARTVMSEVRPVATVTVNPQAASWSGLTEQGVADELFARFEGVVVGSIIEQVEQVPVRVRIADWQRSSFEDIEASELMVSTSAGSGSQTQTNEARVSQQNLALSRVVPLTSLAQVEYEPQRAVITRYNGQRSNTVQTFITAGTLPSKVLGAFIQELEKTDFEKRLPPGFRLEIGGEASERDAAVSRLMANVSVLSVGMVASLVLALASFRLTALIGLVATLSIGLGMGALYVFGYPFGFMAIVGTMGLIGIAINDSIVVVAALKTNPGVVNGDIDATVETVVEVTRHVLATTGTTVFGFLPLLLSGGGFWPPLAVAIGTGVAGATLISVTLVPCVFRLMAGMKRGWGTVNA